MEGTRTYANYAAGAIWVWNFIGILSRIEYIGKRLAWLWQHVTVDLSLGVNLLLLGASALWLVYSRRVAQREIPSGNQGASSPSVAELSQEISGLKAALGKLAKVDAELRAENLRVVDESNTLRTKLSEATRELARRDAAITENEQRQAHRKKRLEEAPKILIGYKNQEGRETLSFYNDGTDTALGLSLGPVTWTEERKIQLHQTVSHLQSGHTQPRGMDLHLDPGTVPLDQYLRRELSNRAATVCVEYVGNGTPFSRTFVLEAGIDGSVNWNPKPVEIRET